MVSITCNAVSRVRVRVSVKWLNLKIVKSKKSVTLKKSVAPSKLHSSQIYKLMFKIS